MYNYYNMYVIYMYIYMYMYMYNNIIVAQTVQWCMIVVHRCCIWYSLCVISWATTLSWCVLESWTTSNVKWWERETALESNTRQEPSPTDPHRKGCYAIAIYMYMYIAERIKTISHWSDKWQAIWGFERSLKVGGLSCCSCHTNGTQQWLLD